MYSSAPTHPNEIAALKYVLEQDFERFIEYFFQTQNGLKFYWNDHHHELIDALMLAYQHKVKRLVINIPPRYSKTEIVVVMFIAWCLAKNPQAQFIHLSFSDELVGDNSARIKELLALEEYQQLWPVQLIGDRSAKSLWRTQEGGGLKASAAGGAVTGFGAGRLNIPDGMDPAALDPEEIEFGGALIIDDPLKPDDADSEVERKKVNKRLNNTIKSRLNAPWTPIIMIMQRLHDDDPTGFVLEGGTGEDWEHLSIPVIRDNGEPLWPLRHGMDEITAIQLADKNVFNGQYMQQPIPDDGDYYTREGANWYRGQVPKGCNNYGASDFAVTEGGGDFTEHGIFSVAPTGNIYIRDWWYGQTKSNVWIEELLDLADEYEPMMWGGETGPIKNAVEPFLMKRMLERMESHGGHVMPFHWVSHNTVNYKAANARSMQGLWEAGRIWLPEDKPWAHRLLGQLVRFPKGTLDDGPDVLGIFGRMLKKVWEQEAPKPKDCPTNESMQDPMIIESFAPATNTQEW